MAKTREKDTINPYSALELLEDIFFQPQSAFDAYLKDNSWGSREILRLHLILSLSSPLFLIIRNLYTSLLDFFTDKTPIQLGDITQGSLKAWLFMIGVILLVRLLDIFRLYYMFWDRTIEWEPPHPGLIMIAFLPFSGAGLFFLFPVPISIGFLLLAFFYSLQLAYHALKNIGGYDSKKFFSLILQYGIFITFISSVFLFSYNVYRMIQS